MTGPLVGTPGRAVTADVVATWLRTQLGETLGIAPDGLDPDVPLAVYGVSSLVSALLLAELEDVFGVQVDPADVPPDITLTEVAELAAAAPTR